MALANPPDHVHVLSGRDLELDAAVSLVQELTDAVEQEFDVRLDAEADAGKDLGPRPSQQFVQRFFLAPCQCIPASHFQAGPGEGIALHQAIAASQFLDGRPLPSQNHRGQKIVEDMPASLRSLWTVERISGTGALAPADHSLVGRDPHQDMIEVLLAAGAGLERAYQGKAHEVQGDLVEPHRSLANRLPTAIPQRARKRASEFPRSPWFMLGQIDGTINRRRS